jgi:hypothetical protein
MNNYRIMYLRDRKGAPIGCIAIDESVPGVIGFQYSVLNPLDEFRRDVARQIAIGRLVTRPIKINVPANISRHEGAIRIMSEITKTVACPSRARRAAQLWLRTKAIFPAKE